MARLRAAGFELAYPERRASHEFIITLRREARELGTTAMDFAKRLLDYGFHAPTTYFPLLVPECLLIEPTETECEGRPGRVRRRDGRDPREAETNPRSQGRAVTCRSVGSTTSARRSSSTWPGRRHDGRPAGRRPALGPHPAWLATLNSRRGFLQCYRSEAAFRQEVWLACVLLPAGLWLGQNASSGRCWWAAFIILLIVELLNTGIEVVVDRIGVERHPLSGFAKDVGSAAVFFGLRPAILDLGPDPLGPLLLKHTQGH